MFWWVAPTLHEKGKAMHEGLIIPLAGIMLPLFLVPTIIFLVHRQKKREWRHQERLRALDMGLPAPEPDRALGGGSVVAIGAGVPLASVAAAWMTTISVSDSHPDYMPIVAIAWGCAFMISCGALITSLSLGVMLIRSRKGAEPMGHFTSAKPAYEPDAYDVVSSRG
jgi:hypothetical protein